MREALYAGSFDPITNGHTDILERALKVFDVVHVVIAINPQKKYLFEENDRVEMINSAIVGISKAIVVNSYNGLTVDYARHYGIKNMIRGLRAVTDFEAEFQLALINRNLAPEIETVFFMTDKDHIFFSSTAVKGIAMYGGNVSNMVCPLVAKKLEEKFKIR